MAMTIVRVRKQV